MIKFLYKFHIHIQWYIFIRNNSLLLTPFQSLPGKFSHANQQNSVRERQNFNRAFKSCFLSPKTKKETGFTQLLLQPPIFLKCFLKSIYPNKVAKNFKFVELRLLKDEFVSRKIESVHFCSYPQAKRSPRQKEITHFTHTRFSEIFYHAETGEDYGAEKMTKIKLARVLVTSLDKFHHLFQTLSFQFLFCIRSNLRQVCN